MPPPFGGGFFVALHSVTQRGLVERIGSGSVGFISLFSPIATP